jgi:hypothetical protein
VKIPDSPAAVSPYLMENWKGRVSIEKSEILLLSLLSIVPVKRNVGWEGGFAEKRVSQKTCRASINHI